MMLTAIPSSSTTFTAGSTSTTDKEGSHTNLEQQPNGMDKLASTPGTLPTNAHFIPMAAVHPPHIIIGPGGGYTLLPSIATPITSTESFGNLTPIHPLSGFTTSPIRPITAVPYYHHQQQPGTTSYQAAQQAASQPAAAASTQRHLSTISSPQQPHISLDLIANLPVARNDDSTAHLPANSKPQVHTPTTPTNVSGRELASSAVGTSQSASGDVTMEEEDEEDSDGGEEGILDTSADDLPIPAKHVRRNSDSTVEDVNAIKTAYPISALIDVPTSLTRSSRTSSLSSSLSSFRFGGSLNQLWASQLSLSGKIPNMKSTGNLNDAAAMPSLGNQYFAFGGSLPELSLTSLTRLLPNSSANDPNISSCPSLFTLFHSPLYVYPSQQHITTPFINANGSISFGSFLSSGTSLCNTQKNSPTGRGGDGSTSNLTSSTATTAATAASGGSTDITGSENKVDESVYTQSSASVSALPSTSACGHTPSSSSIQPEPTIKLPMFSAPLGNFNVITALPTFSTLTRTLDPASSNTPPTTTVTTPPNLASFYANTAVTTSSTAEPSVATNLTTLANVASAQQQKQADHLPHLATIGASTIGHIVIDPLQRSPDSKDGVLTITPDIYVNAAAVGHRISGINVNGIKLEKDPCLSSVSPAAEMHQLSSVMSPLSPPTLDPSLSPKKEKPYKCDHPGCGRSFSFPAHLRSHIQQIHISYRPCKCEFLGCGKRFYTPQHLNVHRRVHTGERPFVCPYSECSKAFTTAGNLKNHIRTHTGERPYACKFEGCTKRFAEMSSLKKHELTHTGEKPYKCRVCGKAFSQAGSRNTHERKHNRTDGEELTEGAKSSRRYRIKRISTTGEGSPDEPQL